MLGRVRDAVRRRPMATSVAGTAVAVAAIVTGVAISQAGPSEAAANPFGLDVGTQDGLFPTVSLPAGYPTAYGSLAARGLPAADVAPNGTDLARLSATAPHDLPVTARQAYRKAAKAENAADPGCGIDWYLIAGIGEVESDHGRVFDAVLATDGYSHPKIRGLVLDGHGVAAIPDTDHGRLDGNKKWDRAVGAMQFLPSTWKTHGLDGDGDGKADPYDLFDAARTTASYLCLSGGDLTSEANERTAVFAYNHSDYYVDLVLAFATGYRTGVFDIPPPPVPVTEDPSATASASASPTTTAPTATDTATDPTSGATGGAGPTSDPTTRPTSKPTKKNTRTPKPTRSPTKGPTPTSSPTVDLVTQTGLWTACDDTWCLNGASLDLGGDTRYDVDAAADFDGDGTVETNREEFTGLVGTTVTIAVQRDTETVYVIGDDGYRNADGSFAS